MIVTRHIGRLGNNMFQIAAAIGHAKRYGYQWAADFGRGVGEPYSCIHEAFPNLPKSDWNSAGRRYHEHPHGMCPIHNTPYDHCHFDYHPIPNLGPDMSLSGFLQSWRYFDNAEDEVRAAFPLVDHAEYRDYVSIHVRRGDYVTHATSFPPVDDEYLLHATDITDGLGKYMVFSDDIKWCRDYFKKYGDIVEFSDGRTEYDDICRMASCSHHIICNSTFSWMAAYLGKNPDRIVVSPSHKWGNWFGPTSGEKKDCVDLIPPGWHEIEWRTIQR
jgi:hypothetical protein